MALNFELKNHNGDAVTQDDYLDGGLVMFFYPRAMTTGCTVEACDFRDNYSDLVESGYNVVGVSPDPPELNAKFREKEGLNFDLLSDEDHALAEELGAWGEKNSYGRTSLGLIRSTFVIGPDGAVEKAYRNIKATGHVARVKEDLLGTRS
ncbi:MAG: thioredoxin-dependent thiol peroxidase [Acidimicrobiia bacterium]